MQTFRHSLAVILPVKLSIFNVVTTSAIAYVNLDLQLFLVFVSVTTAFSNAIFHTLVLIMQQLTRFQMTGVARSLCGKLSLLLIGVYVEMTKIHWLRGP